MFGWKKRDEGFEWQQYVRTTIKLRREARRDKAHVLGRQAAEGARVAGIAAGQMARGGAARVASMAIAGLERAGDLAIAFLGLVGLGLGYASRWLARALGPVADVLRRPGVAGPLILAGSIATAAGLGRIWLADRGLDAEAKGALTIGLICLALGLGPALLLGHRRLTLGRLPSLNGLALPKGRIAIATGIALVLAVVGGLAMLVRPSGLGLAGMPSLPTLPFGTTVVTEGRANALGADRLKVEDVMVQLDGIEAPDLNQRCLGKGRRTWRCGAAAKDALARLVRGEDVRCETGTPEKSKAALGHCKIGERDVGGALVKGGHVFAASGFAARYASEEAEARKAGAGLWAVADPERPQQWRDRMWTEAKARAPDGCPIKGPISRGARVYLMPWSSRYDREHITKRRGERWFCSQAEAEAAGWRSER